MAIKSKRKVFYSGTENKMVSLILQGIYFLVLYSATLFLE